MGTISITHKITGAVLWTGEAETLRAATEVAVEKGAYLEGANLKGAYLEGAKLEGCQLEV